MPAKGGKTETIRKRTVWVYVPTEEHREKWEKLAAKADLTLSRWMLSVVEAHVRGAEDETFGAKADLWKENVKLREQNKRLTDEKKMSLALVEKLEDEVHRYRAELFLNGPDARRVKQYEKDLIDTLRSGGVWGSNDLLEKLRVRATDTRGVRAINLQLENLQGYGLVEATPRGWRWKS